MLTKVHVIQIQAINPIRSIGLINVQQKHLLTPSKLVVVQLLKLLPLIIQLNRPAVAQAQNKPLRRAFALRSLNLHWLNTKK